MVSIQKKEVLKMHNIKEIISINNDPWEVEFKYM